MTTTLPAGYLQISDNACAHVSLIRRVTSDLERFRACLPDVRTLAKLGQDDAETRAIYRRHLAQGTADDLVASLRESGLLDTMLADYLRGELPAFGEMPEPLFLVERET